MASGPCFTGKEEDVEVGLQYFGKRFLNPLLGRWVSADPLAVHGLGEADWNLYAYVEGRLLRDIDPLGLEPAEKLKPQPPEPGGPANDNNQPKRSAPTPAPESQGGSWWDVAKAIAKRLGPVAVIITTVLEPGEIAVGPGECGVDYCVPREEPPPDKKFGSEQEQKRPPNASAGGDMWYENGDKQGPPTREEADALDRRSTKKKAAADAPRSKRKGDIDEGTQRPGGGTEATPDPGRKTQKQDKLLSKGEIKKLKDAGFDIHEVKGGKNASRFDLYKDRDGNVVVKRKGGHGEGDPTGINIKKL